MIRDLPAEIYPGYMIPTAKEAEFRKKENAWLLTSNALTLQKKSNSGKYVTKARPWREVEMDQICVCKLVCLSIKSQEGKMHEESGLKREEER